MDKYATHLPVLEKVFEYSKPNRIFEYGMGLYSTKLLLEKAGKKGMVTSVEMQSLEWYKQCCNHFSEDKRWTSICDIGPYYRMGLPADLIFVDGHGDSRPECVTAAGIMKCPIIIAHDTEAVTYGWERVNLPPEYHSIQILDKETGIGTTVWALDKGLIEYLKVLL